ncbi:MAG: hypothetical protein JZU60_02865 [Ilumatobacteraceae bacterium]|jgi:hypothetical protein|nr:hypothetical protein [Ilumatobacteraceae bacterium]
MKTQLTPERDQAVRFLQLLDPEGIFTFQVFDDDKVRKNMNLARVLHGSLSQHWDDLASFNLRGAGIFVMVNKGDGIIHAGSRTSRTEANVIAVRSLFADLDGAPLAPVLQALPPDIVIESSPERYHAYWLTNDCPLEEFKLRQSQIAIKFNSDPNVCDLPRVMRLPGSFHQKSEPFMTRIISLE